MEIWAIFYNCFILTRGEINLKDFVRITHQNLCHVVGIASPFDHKKQVSLRFANLKAAFVDVPISWVTTINWHWGA